MWYSSSTARPPRRDASLVSVTGTTESLIECSGRGLCDRSTGQCECFPGYASSDGVGGPGKQDDCGYRKAPVPTRGVEPPGFFCFKNIVMVPGVGGGTPGGDFLVALRR